MEIDDDEDFDLETPSRTQSLGMNYYYFLLYRKSSHRAEKVEQEKTALCTMGKKVQKKAKF